MVFLNMFWNFNIYSILVTSLITFIQHLNSRNSSNSFTITCTNGVSYANREERDEKAVEQATESKHF